MTWRIDESCPEQRVTVEWTRRELVQAPGTETGEAVAGVDVGPDANSTEVESMMWYDVRWIQKNGAHWLMHHERGADGSGGSGAAEDAGGAEADAEGGRAAGGRSKAGADQTVLVLRPHQLTWIRRGSVEWRHQFEAEQECESVMTTGSAALSVRTLTRTLDIHVDEQGGVISLTYVMNLAGQEQVIDMVIRFSKED